MIQSDLCLDLACARKIRKGEEFTISGADSLPCPGQLPATGRVPHLRAGNHLVSHDAKKNFLILANGFCSGQNNLTTTCVTVKSLASFELEKGRHSFSVSSKGLSFAWIVLSDKGVCGKRTDECGPLLEKIIQNTLDINLTRGFLIADDKHCLHSLLTKLCLQDGFDLVLTSGGTGVGPRDITPDTTAALIEKRLPGYELAMTSQSLKITPHGAISRAIAGTLHKTLIVNLPGSPKAVKENLKPILPTLLHTIRKLQGDQSDCASSRQQTAC